MRFDEINILGDFRINGLTGGENQFVGLSGGSLFWLDASPNIEGFSVYGTNYILCNSLTYSATASGENLRNAYASASTLVGISSTNRGTILISPGVYDFDSEPLGLSLSYIDLVGISSAASSVTLKATNAPYTLKYYENVDSGLYNVGLTGGSSLGILGSASTYLRWDNVIVDGTCFSDGSVHSFVDLVGEFKNITVRNSGYFATAENSIDGIFDNIYVINGVDLFKSEYYISGTYSNIDILDAYGNIFLSTNGTINGSYKNIKIRNNNIGTIFQGVTASGKIENLKIDYSAGDIFSINFENSILKDVLIKYSIGGNIITGEKINSEFENIVVDYSQSLIFNGGQDWSGTFSNIHIGSCGSAFAGSQISSATFRNIKVLQNQGIVFQFTIVYNADVTDFEIGKCTENSANFFGSGGAGLLNLNARNIIIQDQDDSITGVVFQSDGVSGKYQNIQVGSASNFTIFTPNTYLIGDYQDIDISSSLNTFFSDNLAYIDANCRNIKIGSSQKCFYTEDATISGTFSSIEIDSSSGCFNSGAGSIYGVFEDIKIGNDDSELFYSDAEINIKVYDLKVDSCKVIFSAQNLYGYFRNIEIGSITEGTFLYGSSMVDIDLKNFKISNLYSLGSAKNLSSGVSGGISGTFSDIYINHNTPEIVYFSGLFINGIYENLYLGTAATVFDAAINLTAKNLNVSSYIPTAFVGKISNSYINATGLSQPAILINNNAIIDRCRFIADSGQFSIATLGSITSKITHLISNTSIDPQITNLISDNKNIISIDVRTEQNY